MHQHRLRYLANLVVLKYMNYRTKRKRNRKTKRMKGGSLEYNIRRHEFRGVNNTGRADAHLLNLLRVKLEPGEKNINLLAFYGNPEMKIPGVVRSFKDYYLALSDDPDAQEGVRNFINFIKAERVNDRLRFLAKNPGAPLDGGHVRMYAVTSRLKDFINLIDPPRDKRGVIQGAFFNEDEKASFNHTYAGEFRNLVGPEVPRIVLRSKFLELLGFLKDVEYEREPEEDNGEFASGLTQALTSAKEAVEAKEAASKDKQEGEVKEG
jgi:hypothetical protein